MENQIAAGYVMDIETLSNCIVFCFEHSHCDKKKVFVIHTLKNDILDLYKFLDLNIQNEEYHITFNGLAFDSQIVQWMLNNRDTFELLSASDLVKKIYDRAQYVIQTSNSGEWHDYPEWKMQIKQLDIYKMNHWDNPAKRTSLKWLQCNIDWANVQDMPINHTESVNTMEEIKMVARYCFNDVSSTKKVYQLSSEQIQIRAELTEKYGINLYSASEPSMSKKLFSYFLSRKLNIEEKELKQWATKRDIIAVENILLPYVKFQKMEFNMVLNNFKKLKVNGDSLKGAFKYTAKYRGLKIKFGVGGIHAFSTPGIYESNEETVVKSLDVTSYYPNLSIRNKFAPAHIQKQAFCDQYEWFFEERKKYPKNSPINYILKILLNSTFGLSIDKHSFLSDPQMGCQITINGQLLLCMLLEMLCERIPESVPLVMNTDGMEIMMPRKYEYMYDEICKEWENLTQLQLEHEEYRKLFAYDCNNYIGLFKNGKTKCKGRFEFEDHDKYKVNVLHKNKSFLVVAKGIYEYFINGIEPEDYLKTNRNIYDYCGYARAKGKDAMKEIVVSSDGVTEQKLQKTLRYFIATDGSKIIKWKLEQQKEKGTGKKLNTYKKKETQVVADKWLLKEFNLFEERPWEEYKIDERFYLKEIKKEIITLQRGPKRQGVLEFPEDEIEEAFGCENEDELEDEINEYEEEF